jgi:hypothetical protein
MEEFLRNFDHNSIGNAILFGYRHIIDINKNTYYNIIKIKKKTFKKYQLIFVYYFLKAKMYFDQINVIYGAIAEFCTPHTCSTMSAPCNSQFYWLDEKGKKCKYSASQYIDTILTYSAKLLSDEQLFPTQPGHLFPANFEQLVKKIHKHLFQIMAHMYHAHYKLLLHLKLNTFVNTIYFHLVLFSKMFNLIDDKDLDIMDQLNKALINRFLNSLNNNNNNEMNNTSSMQQQYSNQHQQLMQILHAHQPSMQNNLNSNSSVNNNGTNSSSSSGFSFFKKKLNFNL